MKKMKRVSPSTLIDAKFAGEFNRLMAEIGVESWVLETLSLRGVMIQTDLI